MIHTRGLTRHFRAKDTVVEAVRGIDLDVAAGELVAFLGPNGAGKSTTLRMLTTLLRPTAGTAEVAGHDVVADPAAVRQRIGYDRSGQRRRARASGCSDELVNQGRVLRPQPAPMLGPRSDELLGSLELDDLTDADRQQPLGRPAPAARHRPGHGAPARAALPRRALHRSRPAEPREPEGAHRAPARPSTARRSCSPPTTSTRPTHSPTAVVVDRPRPDHRRRHARRLKAELAGDHMIAHRRRRRTMRWSRSADAVERLSAPAVARRRRHLGRPHGWPPPRRSCQSCSATLDGAGIARGGGRGHPAHPRRRLPRPHRAQPPRERGADLATRAPRRSTQPQRTAQPI